MRTVSPTTTHNPTPSIFLLLILACLSQLCLSFDFHLAKNYTLPQTSSNIAKIVTISEGTLGLVEGTLANCTVRIVAGPDYTKEIVRFDNQTGLVDWPKFNVITRSVVFNKGNQLVTKFYNYQGRTEIKTTITSPVSQNGFYSPKQNLLYFSLQKECPTLVRFNPISKDLEQFAYQQGQNCTAGPTMGYTTEDRNQVLAFAAKNKIYFINASSTGSMEILQTYRQYNITTDYEYSYINSFHDDKTQMSSFVVDYSHRKQNYSKLIMRDNKDLLASFQFFNPSSEIVLTNLTQGSSLSRSLPMYNGWIYHWQNIDRHVLALQYSNQNQSLVEKFPMVVSYDQSFFVQGDLVNNAIVGYQLLTDGSFSIRQKFRVLIPDPHKIVDRTKTFISKDGNKIIFNTQVHESEEIALSRVCQLTVDSLNIYCIDQFEAEKEATQLYHLEVFAAFEKINRIVTMFIKYQGVDRSYQLRLYSMDQLKFIASVPFDPKQVPDTVRVKKIAYQQDQQKQFSPQFLIQYVTDQKLDKGVTCKYIITDDTIIREETNTTDLSVYNLYAYGKYVVSVKVNFQDSVSNGDGWNYLEFYDYTSLKIIKIIPYEFSSQPYAYSIFGNRNIMLLRKDLNDINKLYIYDLDQSLQSSSLFRGIQFIQLFQDQLSTENYYAAPKNQLIFPKRSLFYYYRNQKLLTSSPIKLIYDILAPGVKQEIRMNVSNLRVNSTQTQRYLAADKNIVGRECPIVFAVVDYKYLTKFKDCVPYADAQYFNLDFLVEFDSTNVKYTGIYQSSTKQHIIIQFDHTPNPASPTTKFQITLVRLISNPTQYVWSQNVSKLSQNPETDFVQYINNAYIENVTNNQSNVYRGVIILRDQFVDSIDLEWRVRADVAGAEVVKVSGFDVKGRCYVYAGKNARNTNDSIIIIYRYNNITATQSPNLGLSNRLYIPNKAIKQLLLSDDCTRLAWTTDEAQQRLQVQNIADFSNNTQIIDEVMSVIDMQFIGNDKLLIRNADGVVVIPVPYGHTYNYRAPVLRGIMQAGEVVVISKDGQFMATLIDSKTVLIQAVSTKQQIITFKAPLPSDSTHYIADMSFDMYNNLLIITENGNVFSLSPTPCSDTFINQNGLCICAINQTVYDGTDHCACKRNFYPQANLCICNQTEFLYQNGLCECGQNSTQIDGVCLCFKNFVKKRNRCQCPQSFSYDQHQKQCNCDSGVIVNHVCIASCQFPCATCDQSGNCLSYQGGFYAIIIIGAVLVIGLIAGGIWLFLVKKKRREQRLLAMERDDQEGEQRTNQNTQISQNSV